MDILRPILEFSVLLPGMLLAYLPMKHHLRISFGKLATIMFSLLAVLCMVGGILCYFLSIRTGWAMLIAIAIAGLVYTHTLDISHWKSVNVILAVCSIFSCLNSITRAIDALLVKTGSDIWFCLSAGLLYNLLCIVFVVVAWYPATYVVVKLLDEEEIALTWYFSWILPLIFIGLNLFMIPVNSQILYQSRIMQGYIVIILISLAVLCLFYAMLYLIARSMIKNNRLQKENLFLSMQQAQYNNLKATIEETRQARHDIRHHFQVLSSLAIQKEWTEIEKYLIQVQKSIPTTELILCPNPLVNGVLGHYVTLYKKNGIPSSLELDLPDNLPVSEMDLCLVLSNLLENALEANLYTSPAKRGVKVKIHLHANRLVLITVENSFEKEIREKEGIFQSSKGGGGIGIQSVRRIAEKNGGHCQLSYKNGLFTANVMLRNIFPC